MIKNRRSPSLCHASFMKWGGGAQVEYANGVEFSMLQAFQESNIHMAIIESPSWSQKRFAHHGKHGVLNWQLSGQRQSAGQVEMSVHPLLPHLLAWSMSLGQMFLLLISTPNPRPQLLSAV